MQQCRRVPKLRDFFGTRIRYVECNGVWGKRMNGEPSNSASQPVTAPPFGEVDKLLRPALVASPKMFCEYAMFLEHLLVSLADESIPTALVCPADYSSASVIPPSIEIVRHPAFDLPFLWRQNKRKLVEQLVDFKPTVLHCLCESSAPLVRHLAWQLNLPYVLTVNSLQRRFDKLFISSSRCAKIITPAATIAANIAELYPAFADRIEQINVGTFTSEASFCFSKLGQLVSMITAHPLENVGDFEKLFRAVKRLFIDGYEFMLVITGGGRAESRIWKLLNSLGLSQIVTIVPRLELWRSALAAGDIFIQPRPNTVFNPFLLEAMSVGTAVAGCKGGVDDLLIEDKTAVVFNPDDELSIHCALRRLFDSPEWTRQLARQAQQYLRENHTVSRMVYSILQTYRDAQNRLKR